MRKSEREPYHAGEMAADRRGKQVAETELSSVSSGRVVGTRRRNKKTTTEESDILPVEDGDTVDSGEYISFSCFPSHMEYNPGTCSTCLLVRVFL